MARKDITSDKEQQLLRRDIVVILGAQSTTRLEITARAYDVTYGWITAMLWCSVAKKLK